MSLKENRKNGLHLKTMEEAKETGEKLNSAGHSGMAGLGSKQLPKGAYWHMAKNGHVQRAISKKGSHSEDTKVSLNCTS